MKREDEKNKIEKTVIRRNTIAKIAAERGFKSAYELKDILSNEYGIDVSHETLYRDLYHIEALKGDDFKVFKNKMIATCEAHMENLNKMSTDAKYENQRIKAIDSYFRNASKFYDLLDKMSEKKPAKKKEPVEVEEEEEEDIEF